MGKVSVKTVVHTPLGEPARIGDHAAMIRHALRRSLAPLVVFAALLPLGCTDDGLSALKATDAASTDGAIVDATRTDASTRDAMSPDAEAIDAGTPPSADPSAAGSWAIDTKRDGVWRGARRTGVVAYYPDSNAPRPMIVFLPGFQLESRRYTALIERIASHGFVVVRADPPAPLIGVSHTEMTEDVRAVINWATAADGPLEGRVESTRVAVMGHSLGGKVATMTAHRDGRPVALFAIDPVNGGIPEGVPGAGYTNDLPDIVPSDVEDLTIPVGFVGETTNAQPDGRTPACAPEAQNFQTFYDASTRAPWAAAWTFDGADHMDFVNDRGLCIPCGACQDGTADASEVQAKLQTIAVAFFRLHLFGESQMQAWLTGASVPVGVTAQFR